MRAIPPADSPEFEELLREALEGYPCEPGRASCPNPERCAELRAQAGVGIAAWPWWRRMLPRWTRTEWQLWWLVQRQKSQRLRESWWR